MQVLNAILSLVMIKCLCNNVSVKMNMSLLLIMFLMFL